MKKFLFIILFFPLIVQAQKSYTYLGGGVGASVLKFDRLDQFILNYNTSRTGTGGSVALTKKLTGLSFHSGYSLFYGGVNSETGLSYELSFLTRNSSGRAEAGVKFREFKLNNSTLSIAGGYTIINSGMMDLIVGLSFDFGTLGIATKTDSIAKVNYADLTIGNTPFVQANFTLGMIGFKAKAYYMAQWFSPGLDDMDAEINPNTAMELDHPLNYSSQIGLEVGAFIKFGTKKMNTSNKVIRRK